MYLVKRHQTYWALHDVPRRLHDKLGRRLSKSLGTDNKAKAERLANILWLHDWKRRLDGEKVAAGQDEEALFFRDLVRNAKTEEEREQLKDYIGDVASDRGYRAEMRGDQKAVDAAVQFAQVATGRLVALDEHVEQWLAAISDTPKTKNMKRAEVLKLRKRFSHVQEVDGPAAQKWLADLAKGGASSKTVGRILSFLRGYWKYLREQGITAADPFAGLSPPSGARKVKSWVPFSVAQVVALRKRASTEGDQELADLIELGMWSGARIEELCALKVTEVDLQAKAFKVSDAKTAAGLREVPIHPKLMPTIKRLMGDRRDGCLLDDLTPNKFGDRSNAIGKRFGRLKTAAGSVLDGAHCWGMLKGADMTAERCCSFVSACSTAVTMPAARPA